MQRPEKFFLEKFGLTERTLEQTLGAALGNLMRLRQAQPSGAPRRASRWWLTPHCRFHFLSILKNTGLAPSVQQE
jgi:hypothetical protein